MTLEPPQGLRNNLMRTYTNLDSKDFDDCIYYLYEFNLILK